MSEVSYSRDLAGPQVIDVLLVEDDPGDVLMTTEAFEVSPRRSTLHAVGDGEQAMRFLRRTGEFTGAARPALILLDLNLPGRNGLEVLAELKAAPDLLTIPVVIFSTSQAETDIMASYRLHANAYIAAGRVRRVPEVDGFEPGIIECAQEGVEVLEEEVEQQRELRNRQRRPGPRQQDSIPAVAHGRPRRCGAAAGLQLIKAQKFIECPRRFDVLDVRRCVHSAEHRLHCQNVALTPGRQYRRWCGCQQHGPLGPARLDCLRRKGPRRVAAGKRGPAR